MPQVRYDVRIDHPFTLTTADIKLIKDNPTNKSDDWNESKFKSLKERIKEYYSVVQDDFCPYCGTKITFGGYGEPIEHIVAKSERPDWMFEPKNLALSCYACNTKKGVKTVLAPGCYTGSTYPTDSTCIIIIHPHFDVYLDHIEIVNDLFVKAKNNGKGWNTIDVCGLYRIDLPMQKAHSLNVEGRVVAMAMECLRDINTPTILKQHCQDTIDQIIARYIKKVALGLN